ncbi:MAG: hypothetical protein LBF34_01620 [Puniceicoccales bacterium]|nr:hypothetical protein [Puniceicoccales bacterium]
MEAAVNNGYETFMTKYNEFKAEAQAAEEARLEAYQSAVKELGNQLGDIASRRTDESRKELNALLEECSLQQLVDALKVQGERGQTPLNWAMTMHNYEFLNAITKKLGVPEKIAVSDKSTLEYICRKINIDPSEIIRKPDSPKMRM